MLKRLAQFAAPYKFFAIGSILTLAIFTSLGLLLPLAIKLLIDVILPTQDTEMLIALLIGLVAAYTLRQVFFYCSHYLTFYTSQRILFDIRKKLIVHLQQLSMNFFDNYRTGKLIASLINDVGKIQATINQGLNNLIINGFTVFCVFGILFLIDWQLALICIAAMPIYAINFVSFRKHLHRQNKHLQECTSEIAANLNEVFNGVRVVKSFSKEKHENKNFVSQFRDLLERQLNIQLGSVLCGIIGDIVSAAAIISIIGIGANRIWEGNMTIGSFVSFYAYLGMLFGPIAQLTNLANVFAEGFSGMSRIFSLLDTKVEVSDGDQVLNGKDQGRIEFHNVNFAYNEKPIVKNFNLTIDAGQSIALVGPSGSGKSTITNLLMRFYDTDSGDIIVGGKPIKNLRQAAYRNNIGIVLQEPFLFSGTVAQNIIYGKPDATQEDIEVAAKLANAHDFILSLENGYQTQVGERGALLSGGQKQRIAIARTLLPDPPILILDEATSALDNAAEVEVQQALDSAMGNRTTIIIAHRLSTIRHVDKIVVMKEGEVVETGTHDELLAQRGLYEDLYVKSQRPIESKNNGEKKAHKLSLVRA